MEFTLEKNNASYAIQRYTAEAITINHIEYHQSLILSPNTLISDWKPKNLLDLTAEDFAPILELDPTVVLLGTGEKHQFPPLTLLKPFYERRIGIEIMTTAAACRTFNLLSAEGRAVVAALLNG